MKRPPWTTPTTRIEEGIGSFTASVHGLRITHAHQHASHANAFSSMGPRSVPPLHLVVLLLFVVDGALTQRSRGEAEAAAAATVAARESVPTSSTPGAPAPGNGTHTFSPAGTLHVPPSPALAAAARRTWGDTPVLFQLNPNVYPYEYVTGYADKARTSDSTK
jgi:hypothetical protein